MKVALLLVVCLFNYCGFTQIHLRITCIDRSTLEPVPNVKLFIDFNDSLHPLVSNPFGNVLIGPVDHQETLVINAEHPLYEPQSIRELIYQTKEDTLTIRLALKPLKKQTFNQVVVIPPGIPDTVFNSTEFHVADFEVTNDGDYVLLVYPKRAGHKNSILLFNGNRILDSATVNGIGINLIKDFRDNVHVICQEEVYHVGITTDSIELYSIPKNYFLDYVVPIVDTTTSKYYFSNFNPYYPAFDYFTQDRIDSSYRKILHIEDSLMMELYRSEYKWVDVRTRLWAKQKELETGIDAQIWVGANYFTQSIYYKVPFAPMFKVRDSIYVLDFQADRMVVYNAVGDQIRTTKLLFHYRKDKTGWKRIILKDERTESLYAVFEKDGITYLGKIDLTTGEIASRHRIYHKYVEKIRVFNGHAYYIYRPFESIQKRFLYKERLLD